MTRIHADEISWTDQASPKGTFGLSRRSLTLATEGKKDVGTWGGGHPFDLEIHRVPPGKTNFPMHEHSAQWEAYYILSGEGKVTMKEERQTIRAGDYLVFPPGEAHQINNTGKEDLTFIVVADNPPADLIHYPKSGKYQAKPLRKTFEMGEVDYFKGEE